MAQALKVRLPDGRTVAPSEWTSTPLYSTVEINSGTLQPLPGFSYGLGGPVPGSAGPRNSTIRDTNFEGAGSILAENEELLLFSIQIDLMQIAPTLDTYFAVGTQDAWCPDPPLVNAVNLVKVQRSTLVILRIANTKEYCRAPLGFFGAGVGLKTVYGGARHAGAAGDAPVNTTFHALNGSSDTGENREFATPHRINPGEAFEVSVEFPYGGVIEPIGGGSGLNFGTATDARIRACIYANGVRRRPVA